MPTTYSDKFGLAGSSYTDKFSSPGNTYSERYQPEWLTTVWDSIPTLWDNIEYPFDMMSGKPLINKYT